MLVPNSCVDATSKLSFANFFLPTCSEAYEQSALQAVQLEDGTTAYIQHAVQMPQSNTILAIQADGTVSDLHTDSAIDPETISVLEQYTAKVGHCFHITI